MGRQHQSVGRAPCAIESMATHSEAPPRQLTEWHVGSWQQRASHSARLRGAGALTMAVP